MSIFCTDHTWNLRIPGFNDEVRVRKKRPPSLPHQSRSALVKKSLRDAHMFNAMERSAKYRAAEKKKEGEKITGEVEELPIPSQQQKPKNETKVDAVLISNENGRSKILAVNGNTSEELN